MALADDLLACLALERRIYAIYCRWVGSTGKGSDMNELLGRLADESDRHRTWLWDIAVAEHLTPPPLPELELEEEASYPAHLKTALRELLSILSALESRLSGKERTLIERIRQEDEAQYAKLMALYPAPKITLAPEAGEEAPSISK